MSPVQTWLLAAALTGAGYAAFGWHGAALALSAVAFWLIHQFNRSLRVMQAAAQAPVAHVESAVMFMAGLSAGMTMLDVVSRTGSIGHRVDGSDADWRWSDDGGAAVVLRFERDRLASWRLERPDEPPSVESAAPT